MVTMLRVYWCRCESLNECWLLCEGAEERSGNGEGRKASDERERRGAVAGRRVGRGSL